MIGYGIVGCGAVGERHAALAELQDASLVAVAERLAAEGLA